MHQRSDRVRGVPDVRVSSIVMEVVPFVFLLNWPDIGKADSVP
jgi:hypothetical protein